jgi:predicted O-methyltransferase YrrM
MTKIETARRLITEHVRRARSLSGLEFVNRVLELSGRQKIGEERYRAIFMEAAEDAHLAAAYQRMVPAFNSLTPHKPVRDWSDRIAKRPHSIDIFYVLPRLLQPELVVETGVAFGNISSLLLAALNRSSRGRLVSFELPPAPKEDHLGRGVAGDKIGVLVPDEYRSRWEVVTGDATYELPARIRERNIDLFVHDSLHTYEHMTYEYAFAEKHLKSGGVLISDDVTVTPAFFRYWTGRPIVQHKGNLNIGVVVV